MKKLSLYVLLSVLGLSNVDVFSQSAALNLEKYKAYRDRLKSEFMFCAQDGKVQGSYLPAELRKTDAYGYRIAYWADGTWWQGHYVAMLATEYARFRKDSDTASALQTLEELRCALQVYDRLDMEAETCWNGEASLNGFYLRDDVPSVLKDTFAVHVINGDYTRRCGDLQTTSNGPSQDQAWASYLGLALVLKLVDEPQAADVRAQASAIARRMVEGMQYTNAKGKEFWQVMNPVNALLVQKEGDIQWLKYAHAKAYEKIVGEPTTFGKATSLASHRTFSLIQNNFLIDKYGHFNWYGVMALSTVINEKGRKGKCTYDWLLNRSIAIAQKRPDLQQPILFPHFPLISMLLYPEQQPEMMLPASFYEEFLNAAPACGAHRISTEVTVDQTPAPWHTLSLFCPWHNADEGEYNMIDYMLLYNLYRLVY